jgi:hypothetical protein
LYGEGPILLLLDTYSAHRCEVTRTIAELWKIDLLFIPPGCTNLVQPLDRRVFGVLKAHARQLWREEEESASGREMGGGDAEYRP